MTEPDEDVSAIIVRTQAIAFQLQVQFGKLQQIVEAELLKGDKGDLEPEGET